MRAVLFLKVSLKHGENQQMWLNKFKVAFIEKDIEKMGKLMGSMPQLENLKEMEEAVYLMEEAKNLLYTLKDETALSMKQIQKSKNFLKSTTAPKDTKFDITS